MNWLGAFDVALMVSTVVAVVLLFSSEDMAVLGWGGVFCITPWIVRAMMSFATGKPTIPVQFAGLGDTAWWWAADICIIILWGVLVTLACIALVLAVVSLIYGDSGDVWFNPWVVAPFGVVAVAMLRVGTPLILAGTRSSKAAISLTLDR